MRWERVFLDGGPDKALPSTRCRWVPVGDPEVKIRHGNRTEHFYPTDGHIEISGCEHVVYRWFYCTYVAE
ncbi:DUF5988 family protein [Allorhizocola rhizosphaerae]|uniref:DUF5988 family protein n=1 Tax=Allorhizocola rhizosphaerae TaxID=1872709 RepID=UPI0013C34FD3|nr:DUF5988 family protein [Allorhizocola rhizosphaerae]